MLTKFNFSEFEGNPNSWIAEGIKVEHVALIVGKNSTGKTRVLNVINNFASMLLKKNKYSEGKFNFSFKFNEDINYDIFLHNGTIQREEIKIINGITLVKRDKDKGRIWSMSKQDYDSFSPPEEELTINIRRDLEHYPYIENIIKWAQGVIKITFSQINPDTIAIPSTKDALSEDINTLPYILEEQKTNHEFKSAIKEGMKKIGYNIDYITTKNQGGSIPNPLMVVSIKEHDIQCETIQQNMSAGMYRAFSVITYLEYMKIVNTKKTILIDDIGEGLDFERASKLAKYITEMSRDLNGQVIMTSNDRYLINNIDSRFLCILKRDKQKVIEFNASNKEVAEIIESGLTNFDILFNNMI